MRDITLCHPRLQALTAQLVDKCVGAGLPIKIGESFRSVAEQDALYAQGRTQPGSIVTNARGSSYSSQHQWGIAADFYRADGKGAYNESGDYFKKVGELAKNLGLGWGGDWKSLKDNPHFQWDGRGKYTSAMVRAGKYPPIMPRYVEVKQSMTKDEAKAILKEKAGLNEGTIVFLDNYRYGDDLIRKLAEAMQ